MKISFLPVTVAAGLVLLAVPALRADVVYSVTLDTSVLLANSATDAPFLLDFELNDGSSGDGLGNNTATISNFSLGTGGSLDDGTISITAPAGAISGNLDTALPLVITDASNIVDFNQQFTPGTAISFTLDVTTNVSNSEQNGTGAPDEFSVAVLSDGGAETSAIFVLDITGNPPTIVTDAGGTVGGAAQPFSPVATPESTTPEPSTCALFALGLAGVAAGSRRRRQGLGENATAWGWSGTQSCGSPATRRYAPAASA